MEIIDRSRKKKPDKAVEKILAAILKELPALEKEDACWPQDYVHAMNLCNLRVVIAAHEKDTENCRKQLLKAAATIVRYLKNQSDNSVVEKQPDKSAKKAPAANPDEKPRTGPAYFTCIRTGQRISDTICLARRQQKKRGCGSCKTGRELEKKLNR